MEQVCDPLLLDGLRGVVRCPILSVSYALRLLDRRFVVGLHRMADRVLDGIQVFALAARRLEVGACAVRNLSGRIDHIAAIAGLGADNPNGTLLPKVPRGRDNDSSLLPRLHVSILL